MDERARNKRKLRDMEQEEEDDDADDSFAAIDGVEAEKPGEGLKKKAAEPNKKQKRDEAAERWYRGSRGPTAPGRIACSSRPAALMAF